MSTHFCIALYLGLSCLNQSELEADMQVSVNCPSAKVYTEVNTKVDEEHGHSGTKKQIKHGCP